MKQKRKAELAESLFNELRDLGVGDDRKGTPRAIAEVVRFWFENYRFNLERPKPRMFSLVKAVENFQEEDPSYPFQRDEHLVYLGEIPNMPGHCVVAKFNRPKLGEIIVGYHTDNFKELDQDTEV